MALLILVAGSVLVVAASRVSARLAIGAEIETLKAQRDQFADRLGGVADGPRVVVDEPALLDGEGHNLAAAGLQAFANAIAREAGAQMRSARVDEPVPIGALQKVMVTIELETDIVGLRRVLHDIETHKPYLFVDAVNVRRGRAVGGASRADGGEGEPPLAARIRLFGLAAAQTESDPA